MAAPDLSVCENSRSAPWWPPWFLSLIFLLHFLFRFESAILRQHKNYNRLLDQEEFMADLKADGYIAPDTNMKGGAYGRSVIVCCSVLQTSSWLKNLAL